MREHLRALATVVGLSMKTSPLASLVLLMLSIARALAAPLLAVAAGALVDAAANHNQPRTVLAGLVTNMSFTAGSVAFSFDPSSVVSLGAGGVATGPGTTSTPGPSGCPAETRGRLAVEAAGLFALVSFGLVVGALRTAVVPVGCGRRPSDVVVPGRAVVGVDVLGAAYSAGVSNVVGVAVVGDELSAFDSNSLGQLS